MIYSYLLRKFGLNRVWDKKERNEVLAHNRELWKREKVRRGYTPGLDSSVTETIPELVPSIKKRMEHGHCLVDIGASFGMTAERVRQFLVNDDPSFREKGFESYCPYLIWSWKHSRFIPIEDDKLTKKLRKVVRTSKLEELDLRKDFMKERIISSIKTLSKKHRGRAPMIIEVAVDVGYEVKSKTGASLYIAPYGGWNPKRESPTISQAIDYLFLEAGLKERRTRGGSDFRDITTRF